MNVVIVPVDMPLLKCLNQQAAFLRNALLIISIWDSGFLRCFFPQETSSSSY
jgi:hypothetical protein